MTVRTKPLVRRALWDFSEALLNQLRIEGRQALFPIYQGKLSLFFDPDSYKRTPAFDLILSGAPDLMLATPPPAARLVAAFDLLDGPGYVADFEAKRRFLESHGILYKVVDPAELLGVDRQLVINDAHDVISRHNKVAHLSKRIAINEKQWEMIEATILLAKSDEFVCLHEPALAALFQVADEWMNEKLRQPQHSLASADFARHATVDAVVASSPPNASPLVGIEFDGQQFHGKLAKQVDDIEQKKRERQAVNDRLKDEIFLAAGVPLIRIASSDFWFKDRRPSKTERLMRKRFLAVLGKRIAETMRDSRWRIDRLHEFLLQEVEALRVSCPLAASNIAQHAHELHRLAAERDRELLETRVDNTWLTEELLRTQEITAEGYELDFPMHAATEDWANGCQALADARTNPDRWPVPPGLKPRVTPKLTPTENGGMSIYVDLEFEPDRFLTLGGWTRLLPYRSTVIRCRVVCKPGQEKFFRDVATTFAAEDAWVKALSAIDTQRDELLRCYSRGLDAAAPKTKN